MSGIAEMFAISSEQYEKLLKKNVKDSDFMKLASITHDGYDVSILNKLSIMYFIDVNGPFIETKPIKMSKHEKIIKCAFDNMDINTQVFLAEYENWKEMDKSGEAGVNDLKVVEAAQEDDDNWWDIEEDESEE